VGWLDDVATAGLSVVVSEADVERQSHNSFSLRPSRPRDESAEVRAGNVMATPMSGCRIERNTLGIVRRRDAALTAPRNVI
jgi:hypothetical protein